MNQTISSNAGKPRYPTIECDVLVIGGGTAGAVAAIQSAWLGATVEYADCYRAGAAERDIFAEMISRFRKIGDRYHLKGFAESAMLHHPGGGTSPLGSRDRMLDPVGVRTLAPWTQFAINPVNALAGFKTELQGIVQPDGRPPLVPQMSGCAVGLTFRKVADGASPERMKENELVRRWWDYNADLMECKPDHEPVSVSLTEVFHMD